MKKLAKVLAVVLAIALLACPFASAAFVDAGADNDALKVEIVDETDKAVRVTVESKAGFVAAQGWLAVTGVTRDKDEDNQDKDPVVYDYSVLNGTFEEDEYEPSVDVSLVNGVISFIVTAADSASLAKYVKVVVDIPVILADDFSVTATKFVAGDDIENEETFIEIGFTDKDGVINTEDPNVQASVTDEDLEPAHEHDFTGEWKYDTEGHWHECKADGCTDPKATDTKVGHTWGDPVIVQPTTEAKGSKTYTCECGAEKVEDIPVVAIDSNITFTANVAVQEKLGIAVNLTKSQYAKYDHVKVLVSFGKYDASYNVTKLPPVVLEGEDIKYGNKTMDYCNAFGIGMYELGLSSDVYMECYDEDDILVAQSNVQSFVPATLLKTLYKSNLANVTNSDEAKKAKAINTVTVVSDLLVMGGEAERYFKSYRAKDGCDLKKVTTFSDSDDPTYDFVAADYATPDTYDYDNEITTYDNFSGKVANKVDRNVSMATSPTISYGIKQTGTKAGYISITDASKLVLTMSYRSYHIDKVNGEMIEEVITGDQWQDNSGYFFANLSSVKMFDGNKELTVVCEYNGSVIFTDSISVETLAKQNKDHAQYGSAIKAVARYEASSRAYFGNK